MPMIMECRLGKEELGIELREQTTSERQNRRMWGRETVEPNTQALVKRRVDRTSHLGGAEHFTDESL